MVTMGRGWVQMTAASRSSLACYSMQLSRCYRLRIAIMSTSKKGRKEDVGE